MERPRFSAPTVGAPGTRVDDPRVGHLLGRGLGGSRSPAVVMLGFPSDAGVRRNGGRVGAAGAPTEIRRALYRMTPDARSASSDALDDLLALTEDRGDLVLTGELESDQALLGQAVREILEAGAFGVVLGGGHETAFGHFLGYAGAGRKVTLFNLDAHTDVREPVAEGGHSGSPFRQALLHPSGAAAGYVVAGLSPMSVARAHAGFIRDRGGQAIFRDALTVDRLGPLFESLGPGPALASFDIDAVDGAFAPGVSAPAVGGLSAEVWLAAAYQAGRCSAVSSFDVVETNPALDRDGQTARLAAATIWWLLRGLADRP